MAEKPRPLLIRGLNFYTVPDKTRVWVFALRRVAQQTIQARWQNVAVSEFYMVSQAQLALARDCLALPHTTSVAVRIFVAVE
jgi:hypothetical protein